MLKTNKRRDWDLNPGEETPQDFKSCALPD